MITKAITYYGAPLVVGFVMTDAMWALLIGQLGTIAIMVVKDRRDLRNREQDRLDRESAAALARQEIAKVAVAGGQREERIVAEVKAVQSIISEAADKTPSHVIVDNPPNNPVKVKAQ